MRGDDKYFAGESSKLTIAGTGANLIATAEREGVEQIIESAEKIVDPRRRALAIEFGINNIHFVPVPGRKGMVMEYGRLAGTELEVSNLLKILKANFRETRRKAAEKKRIKPVLKAILEGFFLMASIVKIHGSKDLYKGISYAVVSMLDSGDKATKTQADDADKVKTPVFAWLVQSLLMLPRGMLWITRESKKVLGFTSA